MRFQTAEDTRAFGAELAKDLRPGDLVILSGPLGAGKTVLTQGIGRGLGIASPITSPTFVIARVHQGPTPLVHVDAYRVKADLDDLGIDDDLEQSVVVVEWGEGVVEGFSDSHLLISMQRHDDDSRTLHVTGVGPRWEGRTVPRGHS